VSVPDELLALALARPHEALKIAHDRLAAHPTPYEASVARQTCSRVWVPRSPARAGPKKAWPLSTSQSCTVKALLLDASSFGGQTC
jgi:hypothetical protein